MELPMTYCVKTTKRDFTAIIYSCRIVEEQMKKYRETSDKCFLFTSVIMTVVALESFINNLVEAYRPESVGFINDTCYMKEKIKISILVLKPGLRTDTLKGWNDVCSLIRLRNSLVHNKVTDEIMIDRGVVQENKYKINLEGADIKVFAVKIFISDLKQNLAWNSPELEGGISKKEDGIKIKERFNEFFRPFEEIEF